MLTYELDGSTRKREEGEKKLLIESKVTILFIYIACISLLWAISLRAKSHTKVAFDFCFVIVFRNFLFFVRTNPYMLHSRLFRYSLEADEFIRRNDRKLNVMPLHYGRNFGLQRVGITPLANHAFFSFSFLSARKSWRSGVGVLCTLPQMDRPLHFPTAFEFIDEYNR